MHVEIFTLCREAKPECGAVHISFAFSQLVLPALPLMLPGVKAVARIRFEVQEEGDHILQVQGFDLDGAQVIMTAEAKIRVECAVGDSMAWATAVFDLGALTIRHAGDLRFELRCSKQSVQSIWLSVKGGAS
jgi:hypothetical protein